MIELAAPPAFVIEVMIALLASFKEMALAVLRAVLGCAIVTVDVPVMAGLRVLGTDFRPLFRSLIKYSGSRFNESEYCGSGVWMWMERRRWWAPVFTARNVDKENDGPTHVSLRISFLRGTYKPEHFIIRSNEIDPVYAFNPYLRLRPLQQSIEKQADRMDGLGLVPEAMEFVRVAKRWRRAQQWFLGKELPWKLGVLLHGPPGTGKTSLAVALATDLGLELKRMPLGQPAPEVISWWKGIAGGAFYLILIEDLDAVYKGREPVNPSANTLPFSELLNMLSGVDQIEGMLVITTNHLEDIDPAIAALRNVKGSADTTRPGRIDYILHMPPLDLAGREKIASRILSDFPDLVVAAVAEGEGETGAQFTKRCADLATERFFSDESAAIPEPEVFSTTLCNKCALFHNVGPMHRCRGLSRKGE